MNGELIQAHGGGILFHDGVFYLYGENKDGPTYTAFSLRCRMLLGASARMSHTSASSDVSQVLPWGPLVELALNVPSILTGLAQVLSGKRLPVIRAKKYYSHVI